MNLLRFRHIDSAKKDKYCLSGWWDQIFLCAQQREFLTTLPLAIPHLLSTYWLSKHGHTRKSMSYLESAITREVFLCLKLDFTLLQSSDMYSLMWKEKKELRLCVSKRLHSAFCLRKTQEGLIGPSWEAEQCAVWPMFFLSVSSTAVSQGGGLALRAGGEGGSVSREEQLLGV